MDPVTHAIIGLGISALGVENVSLTNPIVIGSVLGAISPDIDIITKYRGDYEYLKHHRGVSHSILGLGVISLIISSGLKIMFSNYSFTTLLFWTFLGCLSHSLFDILNSYGVRFFLPFNKKKFSIGLLMLYDPFITLLCLGLVIFDGNKLSKTIIASSLLAVYLTLRLLLRFTTKKMLENKFGDKYEIYRINILPALINPLKWDFIIEAKCRNIVGQVNPFTKKMKIRRELRKDYNEIINIIKKTELGRYFLDFTPIPHFKIIKDGEKILLKIIDLRYILRNEFMHHGTIILDEKMKVIKEIFHPYNPNNNILVRTDEAA